ncbi:MAG: hypothetical protein HY914_19555 [Desulfomonile tiedjei]|nr:hypothetical protein [Desulfomonile tiedjei]
MFTKYDTIHGEVERACSDAIQDEKRGLVCSSRVKLPDWNLLLSPISWTEDGANRSTEK